MMDVEVLTKLAADAIAKRERLDLDRVCGIEIEGDGDCEFDDCPAVFFEEHDAAAARGYYRSIARSAVDAVIDPIRAAVVEQCAQAAEAFDDPDRDWLRRSVWDEIKRDTAARIRKLADVK